MKGLYMDDKDHFYSILYSHLVKQIQDCIKDLSDTRKDDLHENVIVMNQDRSNKEIDALINKYAKESSEEKYSRLAMEYEELGDLDKANEYIKKRIDIDSRSISLWKQYALFQLRNYGDFDKAEEWIRETIGLWEDNDDQLFLVYGALLVQMQQKEKALIFLTKVGKEEGNPEFYIHAHILMSILYRNLGVEEKWEKHMALASRMVSRQKGDLIAKTTLKESDIIAETSEQPKVLPRLLEADIDELYFNLIENILIPEGITQLASQVIDLISDSESKRIIKIKANIQFCEK
jgi:tetratricopeptide (TPR) repeat protein